MPFFLVRKKIAYKFVVQISDHLGNKYGTMDKKKTDLLPAIRISAHQKTELLDALMHYGMTLPVFARACCLALIRHTKKDDRIIMPIDLRVEREWMCPHCHHHFTNVEKNVVSNPIHIKELGELPSFRARRL